MINISAIVPSLMTAGWVNIIQSGEYISAASMSGRVTILVLNNGSTVRVDNVFTDVSCVLDIRQVAEAVGLPMESLPHEVLCKFDSVCAIPFLQG